MLDLLCHLGAIGAALPRLAQAMAGFGAPQSDLTHLRAGAKWLLAAERAAERRGFAHSYALAGKWLPAYPETTGYILPTLRRVAAVLGPDPLASEMLDARRRALSWLLSIQREDGAFPDLDNRPQVFDTGQILIGLNDCVRHPLDLDVRAAQLKAARWLISVQESDGAFRRCAYLDRPHAYYSRVGSALCDAGLLLQDDDALRAGKKQLDWALAQRLENGFYGHLSFGKEAPFLHTIVYLIEGFLDGAATTQDRRYADAARDFATRLANVFTDGLPRAQYDSNFVAASRAHCLTGLAQWTEAARRMDIASESRRDAIVNFLKSRQMLQRGDDSLNGGLWGSDPPWGPYLRFSIPNWGVKFFLDALLGRLEARAPA